MFMNNVHSFSVFLSVALTIVVFSPMDSRIDRGSTPKLCNMQIYLCHCHHLEAFCHCFSFLKLFNSTVAFLQHTQTILCNTENECLFGIYLHICLFIFPASIE